MPEGNSDLRSGNRECHTTQVDQTYSKRLVLVDPEFVKLGFLLQDSDCPLLLGSTKRVSVGCCRLDTRVHELSNSTCSILQTFLRGSSAARFS